jgi:ribonuclease Z
VFITHFHADHWLGLPGMLKTFSLRGRDRALTVHGPPGLKALFKAMHVVIGKTTYPLHLVELDPGQELQRDGYLIAPFPVEHRVTAYGYAIVEQPRPGRFDEAKARELGVKPGPDFGRLQDGEAVGDVQPGQVLGPARPGRKVVLTGDTRPCEMTRHVAHGADLLVHEATFTEEDADRAAETSHSTARAAAALARDSEVKMLALTHVSPRYSGGELRDEARAEFDNTIVPRDFDSVEIPLPERGPPIHHRDALRSTGQQPL